MHSDKTVNNGCLVHFLFCWTSGIPRLSTVMLWASLRNVLTGQIPLTLLMACLGFVGWDLRDQLNEMSLTFFRDSATFDVQVKWAKFMLAMDDVTNKYRLVHNIPSCVFAHACVSLPCQPTLGPWGAMTRVIKVYKCEAWLSIKLTSCPRSVLLRAELHQTPENPWPCFDREARKAGSAWAETLE